MSSLKTQEIRPQVLELLKKGNPNLEIWWDAHPGFYRKFLSNLSENGANEESIAHLHKWMSHNEAGTFFFDGVTTNPPLTLKFLQTYSGVVSYLKEKSEQAMVSTGERLPWFDLYWMTGKLGVDKFLSNFYRRSRKYGFVCVQVDPRHSKDEEIMKLQALQLSKIGPNVMIKIPATKAGLRVIEFLTELGVPTNATSCFCTPQVFQVAQAVKRGYQKGLLRGVDYSGWRSVITMMSGRWEESPELFEEAKGKGIELSKLDLRWFGIRMVQRAVEEVEKLQSPTKVLVCSTRKGPGEDYLHLKALSRLPIVITMNPDAITWGITLLDEEAIENFVLEMPKEVEDKLNKLDFVRRTWNAQGFSMDEIEASGAQINNLRSFSDAMSKIEEIFTE